MEMQFSQNCIVNQIWPTAERDKRYGSKAGRGEGGEGEENSKNGNSVFFRRK